MGSSLFSLLKGMRRIAVGSHNLFSGTVRSFSSKKLSRMSLYSIISPIGNPKISIVPELDSWVDTGKSVRVHELIHIIRDLRKRRRFSQALEVSEWMSNRGICELSTGDHAIRLDLIGKVRGLDSAESYFNSLNEEERTDKIYSALLNCYVRERLSEKSVSHMQKMKEMGFVSTSLPYNNLMSLYTVVGQHEKVPDLLNEMKENGILPNNFSYRVCINSYGSRSDIEGMEKVLKEMTQQHFILMDWNTYAVVANFYIKAGHAEKAVAALKKAEDILLEMPDGVGFNHIVSLYGNLGNKSEVLRLKEVQRSVCERLMNRDYIAILGALTKLGELEESRLLLQEWEFSGNGYDFRVPNTILIGYCQKGLVEEAELLLEEIVKKGKTPIPNSFGILAAGYMDKGEMGKAVDYMMRALSVFPGNEGWNPNPKVVTSILNWLGQEGDIKQVESFVGFLSAVVPINREMYLALIKANLRGGKEVDGLLKSMEADKLEVDEETKKMLENLAGGDPKN
ncbi:pentatricopeptide repeat-containing protein, mitochondrial [Cinnamomum micranthum f. kanehirae]|uniref:Pentatricopeptide repeat-containing protein, mitochondrial n=1 Tax=Cinnamomum micranthum f. kanehirae TaxID=337451 RepID=A0A3S3M923_9MAGN|nr:pentatricopeptide repeat-containing protein, mitochondrial [Cinnamomum micranthum f. kanehirae]